jgi:succinoglycan biosynthesis transport protein ExoP
MKLLRKRAAWVVLAMMACIAGAWLVSSHAQTHYASTAQVDVESHVFANTVPVTPNLATEKSIALSGRVLDSAAGSLGLTPGGLVTHLAVSSPASTSLLSIACTMPEAVAAQQCATAVAQAYADFRNDAGGAKSVRASDPFSVTIVTPAALPTAPAGSRTPVMLSLGAFLGLALGIGTAFVRDRFDDRVRDRADLEQCLDAPVLAVIPRVRRSADPESVFCGAPLSQAAEAYRHLRVRLDSLISPAGSQGKVVLVAGAQAGEGRTCVASNLAAALAQAGANVLLVDADLRHPSLSGVRRDGEWRGLIDLLAGRASLDDVITPTAVGGLGLVTVGTATDRPVEMFEVARLTRVFASMTAAADVVVVDSGPALTVSDPIALTRVCDVVVVVANVRRTRRAAVRAAAREIRDAGSGITVGVITGAPRSLRNARPRRGFAAGLPPQASPVSQPAQISAGAPDGQEAGPHRSWRHRVLPGMRPRALKSDVHRVNHETLAERRARLVDGLSARGR